MATNPNAGAVHLAGMAQPSFTVSARERSEGFGIEVGEPGKTVTYELASGRSRISLFSTASSLRISERGCRMSSGMR